MPRPRLEAIDRVPPTEIERERGSFVVCVDCPEGANEWSAPFADRRRARCLNHQRHQYRVEGERRARGGQRRPQVEPARVAAMRAEQGDRCAICELPFTSRLMPELDWDPATGQVRSLLCLRCSGGLGMFRGSVKTLEAAVGYVQRHTKRTADTNKRRSPAWGLVVFDEKGAAVSLMEIDFKRDVKTGGWEPVLNVEKTWAKVSAWISWQPSSALKDMVVAAMLNEPMTQRGLVALLDRIATERM